MIDRAQQKHLHRETLRVYYEDTDAGGIVYYANYLKFIERGRTELLRQLGVESSQMMTQHGVAFAVKRCTVDYRKPAVLDDELIIETEVLRLGGASLDLQQTVRRGDDIMVLVDIKLACLDLGRGKPRAMPGDVRAKLDEYFDKAQNREK